MFIEVLSHMAVTTAFEAYEHSSEIKTTFAKAIHWIKNGKIKILIVGAGGVGKTTLAKFLSNPSEKIPPNEYSESFHVERISFPGGVAADLIAAPGQERHLQTWEDLFDCAKKEKSSFGIIYVSAYGYHSTSLDLRTLRAGNETTEVATRRYIGECRLKEIELLSNLSSSLEKHNMPIWMISLITKQDLWWHDRQTVSKHYESGEYSKIIERLSVAHRVSGFRHEYFSSALHSQNFTDGTGSVIANTASGYDDKVKFIHQEKLLEMISGFISPK